MINLLEENYSLLPPVIKGKDKHYLNPIHILEYADQTKIPPYDKYCPSIAGELHFRLCCITCEKYFHTLSFVTKHQKNEHGQQRRRKTSTQADIEEPSHGILSNSAVLDTFSSPYILVSSQEELSTDFQTCYSEGEP